MPRTETVTTPQTPGAGRRYSYSLLQPGQLAVAVPAGGVAGSVVSRPGGLAVQSFFDFITVGAPPAGSGGQVYKGIPVLGLTSNTLTGRYMVPDLAPVNDLPSFMPFQTERATGALNPGGDPSLADDFACWSVSVMCAYDAIPGVVTGDIGLSIGVATRWGIRSSTFAGTEFGPSDTGVISVIVRQVDGGALTYNQPIPEQPDMTEYNTYEIRMLSATASREAQFKYFINDRLQLTLSYGVGTVLPSQLEGTSLGFTAGLGNYNAMAATTRIYIVPGSFVVKCGPTESSLL